MKIIDTLLSGAIGRAIRSSLSVAISAWIAKNQNNPYYLAIAPLLQTIGKYLRDKWPNRWGWLPF